MSPTTKEEEKKALLIVTGASRGLGRAVAIAFCHHHITTSKIHAVLVGRSESALRETAELLSTTTTTEQISWRMVVADLGDLDRLDDAIDRILLPEDGSIGTWDECILINNAGSLGHIGLATDAPSLRDLQHTVDLNVTSALWLSVRVARFCQQQQHSDGQTIPKKCTVVNISSLLAIQPFLTLGVYSAGKAARDAFHTAMAQELLSPSANDDDDDTKDNDNHCVVRILNYAPGPLEGTDMTQQLRTSEALHATLQPHYQKTLVDVNDSALALVRLLQSDNFTSGQHVDYYDLLAGTGDEDDSAK